MLHVQPTFLDEVILMKQWTAKFPDEMNAIEACQKQVQSGQEQLQTGMIRGSEVQTRLNVKVAKEYFCMKKCVKEAESELTKQKAELDGLQKQLAGAKEALEKQEAELDQLNKQLRENIEKLEASEQKQVHKDAELQVSKAEEVRLQAQLAGAKEAHEKQEAELDQLNKQLRENIEKLEASEQKQVHKDAELQVSKAEVVRLQAQLAGAKEDLNGLSSKLDTRDQELIQTKKDLNATISEVGDLKLVVSQQEMDIAQGKADIQRMESEREAEKERTDRSHDLDHETKPIVNLYKGRAVYNGHSFDVLTIELTG